MKTSRIVIGVAIAATAGALVIFGSPSKPPPFGIFGWIGVTCMLAAALIGAVTGLREFLAERASSGQGDTETRVQLLDSHNDGEAS